MFCSLKKLKRLAVVLCFLALHFPVLAVAQKAIAQNIDSTLSEEHRKTFIEVESNILSPFCPGRLLKDCPSSAARDLKVEIKENILAGKTSSEIVDILVLKYGKDLSAAPSFTGIGLLAWYAPLGFLLLGGCLLFFWILKQSRND